jgi:hypothetical protein
MAAPRYRRPNHFLAAGFTQRLVARCTKERGQ